MTQLYINNKLAIIDDSVKFIFSYTVSDLEDFTIIGLPTSKTVSLPRCSINDDIFGHVANINRVVSSDTDNLIGISFNQSKKVQYTLVEDSVVKSEGIIIINNITDSDYEVTLFDKLLDLIQKFEGDEEDNTGYLSSLDLINQDDELYADYLTSVNIENFDTTFGRPTFNIKDYEKTNQCWISQVVGGNENQFLHTLPTQMTPLSFRSFKPWQVDVAVPVNNVIKSINYSYPNSVTYSSELNSLFSDLHIVSPLHKEYPKSIVTATIPQQSNMLPVKFNYIYNQAEDNPIQLTYDNSAFHRNANFKIKLSFSGTIVPTNPSVYETRAYATRYNNPLDSSDYTTFMCTDTVPDGTYLGDIVLNIGLIGTAGGGTITRYQTKLTSVKIPLYFNENITFVVDDDDQVVSATLLQTEIEQEINVDAYNALRYASVTDSLVIDFNDLQHKLIENSPSNLRLFFYYDETNNDEATFENPIFTLRIEDGSYVRTSFNELRAGDYITGKNIFPKVSIKDFLVGLAKTFNLNISNNNGVLHISPKEYVIDYTVPTLQIERFKPLNFDFDKLKLTSKLPDSQIFEDYETDTSKIYGQKLIRTGYSIKKNTNEIELPYACVGYQFDINSYAYQTFMNYNNAGYSKNPYGDISGLEELTFCFLKQTNETIYISDDSYIEADMISGNGTPNGINWILNNTEMFYDSGTTTYYFRDPEISSYVGMIDNFYTVCPYKFSGDTITDSLEIGKPAYNFAGIKDDKYPESTTLYEKYFKDYIEDIYNVNTHILEVKMFINDDININRIYNYNNSYYIIQELSEYDPTKPGVYSVKLRRINNINAY